MSIIDVPEGTDEIKVKKEINDLSPKIQSVIDADNKLQELSRDNNDNPNLGYINAMYLLFPHEEIHSDDISNLLLKKYAI